MKAFPDNGKTLPDGGKANHRMHGRSKLYQVMWGGLSLFGIDLYPNRTRSAFRNLPQFISEWRSYNRLVRDPSQRASLRYFYPVLADRDEPAGNLDIHYWLQDLWAARLVCASGTEHHVDVGSRFDGFVAHVLSCVPVTLIDLRPAPIAVSGLSFIQADATTLKGVDSNSIDSLSSLHAAEHFGLGRYGDPIDPDAHLRFMSSLARVLRPGGKLYFSVPTGLERVYFNAHRVLSTETVLCTMPELTLLSFCAITDDGDFIENCDPSILAEAQFGCGLYEFTKLSS